MTDDEINEALAVKVLGWRQVKFPALVTEAVDDGIIRFIVNSDGRIETRIRRDGTWGNWQYFSPLTNPADSKMVREKLAELGWQKGTLQRRPPEEGHLFSYGVCTRKTGWITELAHTEERAVALCALRTAGIEATPSPQ